MHEPARTPDPARSRAGWTGAGWIGLAARLVLAVVWLWASLAKLPAIEQSVLAVRGYQVLPYELAVLVGYLLPMIELVLGVLLVIGLFNRWSGLLSALLMLAFIIGIAQAWARGLSIDCGCFGGGGQIALEEAQAKYPWELARDFGLMLLGAWLVWRPKTPFSLDQKLFGEIDPGLHEDLDEDDDLTDEIEEDTTR